MPVRVRSMEGLAVIRCRQLGVKGFDDLFRSKYAGKRFAAKNYGVRHDIVLARMEDAISGEADSFQRCRQARKHHRHFLLEIPQRLVFSSAFGGDAHKFDAESTGVGLRNRQQITFTSCIGPDSIAGWMMTNPGSPRSTRPFVA